MARMGPEKQVPNTIPSLFDVPFSSPDPLSIILSAAALVPQAGHSLLRYWAALLPGFWMERGVGRR